MCDLSEYLEPCDVWEQHYRRARKPHTCSSCGSVIKAGERYLSHFSVFQGEPSCEKLCSKCAEGYEKFSEEHGDNGSPSYFPALLQECVWERESFSSMLKWSRVLRGIRNRNKELKK